MYFAVHDSDDDPSEVVARFSAHLQCHSHFSTYNPGFAIPAALVRRIAAVSLGIDFDLYVIYEDDLAVPASDAPADQGSLTLPGFFTHG